MKKSFKTAISIISVVAMVFIWQFAAEKINARIIVPTPYEVFESLKDIMLSEKFLSDLGSTVLRTLESFVIIFFAGAVFGIIAGSSEALEAVFRPFVTLFKAIPVMSVILIAFIWLRTGQIPVFSAFLMAFPVMYVQTLEGMKHISRDLEQMCQVYSIEKWKKLVNFTIPSLVPSLVTGAKQSFSMIWKVVIAAEVLTIPDFGLGRSMHMAQIQLETDKVFAWTFVAVVLTWIGDFLFAAALKKVLKRSVE